MGMNYLILFLLFPIITTATNCSYTCGNQTLRFPFQVSESPLRCGYPGFNLICKAPENQTFISLPGSGEFLVREINYTKQTIQLYDQQNCLPKRLIGFNLSATPFLADLSSNFTLYSCPKQLNESLAGFPTIDCLGNSTMSVIAVHSETAVTPRCQKMVPTQGFPMGDVLELRWDVPQCQDCEGNGGMCGFDHQNQIVCYFNPATGGPKQSSTSDQVFKIIALSITIPAMLCSVGVGIFLCAVDSRESWNQQTAVNPQIESTIEGLDQATIDSYTKVVLGESKRVPGPNKDMCPICLSEFSPADTLRCIPECQHSFHADCIDEWLRLKGTCPLCRKSPSPLHEIVVQHTAPPGS